MVVASLCQLQRQAAWVVVTVMTAVPAVAAWHLMPAAVAVTMPRFRGWHRARCPLASHL